MPGRSNFRARMEGRRSRSRINMTDCESRKNTFHLPPAWENRTQDPVELASNGFYYTGQEDIVTCYSCGVRLSRWKETHDAFTRHFESSPNCAHLRKDHMGSILQHCEKEFLIFRQEKDRLKAFQLMKWPLSNLISYEELSRAGFFPTGKGDSIQCFRCGCKRDTWHSGDSAVAVHRSLFSECPFLKELIKSDHNSAQVLPKPPDYSSLKVRLQSFKHFPSDFPVDKEELAKSGFYLVQPPSVVRCYACRLTISSFKKGELPDKIHVNRSPDCPLLKMAEDEPMAISECPPVTPDVTSMEVEVAQIHSPPPDPSCLPPPVISEQDLQSMFRHPTASSNGIMMHEAPLASQHLSLDDQLRHPGAGLPLRHLQTEMDSFPSSAHQQPMILDQPVFLPPSYHQKRVSPQPNSLPASAGHRERQYYTPSLLSTPSTYSIVGSGSRRSDKCIICFVHPKEYAIYPCGHLCSCRDCAKKLATCPVCRGLKKAAIKIFDV